MDDIRNIKSLYEEVSQILGSPNHEEQRPPWETKGKRLVENTLVTFSSPIRTPSAYREARKRLQKLEEYQRTRPPEEKGIYQAAIEFLRDRIDEYESKSLPYLIRNVAELVRKGIKTEQELEKARAYLSRLQEEKPTLKGNWQKTTTFYIDKLQNAIAKSEKVQLGAGPVPAQKDVPDWLVGFSTVTTRIQDVAQERGWEVPEHTVNSKYCKVQEVEPGTEYLLGFEDRDAEFAEKMGGPPGWPAPDWDYDEPLVRVRKEEERLKVKIEEYGGYLASDLWYAGKKLFEGIGGWFNAHVGEEKTVAAEVPKPPKPKPEKPAVGEWLKKYAPWMITLGALFAGGIALAGKKEE